MKRDTFRYESFYASASTDGERLYTIARSGKIVALDASSGRVLWTDDVNSLGYSTPAVGRDRIFVGDFNGGLRAYREDRTAGSSGARTSGAGSSARRSSSATSSSSRRSRRRRTPRASRTGRSSGATGSASTRRASRRSGRTTSRSTGMLVAFRGRDARSHSPAGFRGRIRGSIPACGGGTPLKAPASRSQRPRCHGRALVSGVSWASARAAGGGGARAASAASPRRRRATRAVLAR